MSLSFSFLVQCICAAASYEETAQKQDGSVANCEKYWKTWQNRQLLKLETAL